MDSLRMEIKTFDQLAGLQDSQLAGRMRAIRQLMDQCRNKQRSTHDLEVELCYAQREFDIRSLRSRLHNSRRR